MQRKINLILLNHYVELFRILYTENQLTYNEKKQKRSYDFKDEYSLEFKNDDIYIYTYLNLKKKMIGKLGHIKILPENLPSIVYHILDETHSSKSGDSFSWGYEEMNNSSNTLTIKELFKYSLYLKHFYFAKDFLLSNEKIYKINKKQSVQIDFDPENDFQFYRMVENENGVPNVISSPAILLNDSYLTTHLENWFYVFFNLNF